MKYKKGKGWHGDPKAHKKAGQKGGKATALLYGEIFYKVIGSLGGKVSGGNFARDPQRAQELGRLGGMKRSQHLL